MIQPVIYTIDEDDRELYLTITPVNQKLPGGNLYSTGVYKLSSGTVGMGYIEFNDAMDDWVYNGLSEFTLQDLENIADFIKNYKDPVEQ